MSQRKEDEKKRKKKQEAQIEAFLLSMLEKSMKSALDTAMKELFKDWKWFNGEGFHLRGTLAVIVVYSRRLGLCWLHREQPQKTVIQNKKVISWECEPRYTTLRETIFLLPQMGAGGCSFKHLIS